MRLMVNYGYDTETGEFFNPQEASVNGVAVCNSADGATWVVEDAHDLAVKVRMDNPPAGLAEFASSGFEGLLAALCLGDDTWSSLFPEGRTIFYEGGDPEGFREEIQVEFGFDVASKPGDLTGFYDNPDAPREPTWNEDHGWAFHCPPEHLDAIYGSGRWPMGS